MLIELCLHRFYCLLLSFWVLPHVMWVQFIRFLYSLFKDRFFCYIILKIICCCFALKAPAKNSFKINVCVSRLLQIFDNIIGYCKYQGKQCGPRWDSSFEHSKLLQEKSDLDLHFLSKSQQTTKTNHFVVFCTLRVNPFLFRNCHLCFMSVAYIQIDSRISISWKQTQWTLIRLLLRSSLIWVHIVCNIAHQRTY